MNPQYNQAERSSGHAEFAMSIYDDFKKDVELLEFSSNANPDDVVNEVDRTLRRIVERYQPPRVINVNPKED